MGEINSVYLSINIRFYKNKHAAIYASNYNFANVFIEILLLSDFLKIMLLAMLIRSTSSVNIFLDT